MMRFMRFNISCLMVLLPILLFMHLNHWEMDVMRSYNFGKSAYYEPIPGGEISKNPNLYPQNPLY